MKIAIAALSIFCCLCSSVSAKLQWPAYVDNAPCIAGGKYATCGHNFMPTVGQYTDAGVNGELPERLNKLGTFVKGGYTRYKIVFWAEMDPTPGESNEFSIPLESSVPGRPYRLIGLNGSSFDIFLEGGCYVKTPDWATSKPPSDSMCVEGVGRQYLGSIGINELLGNNKQVQTKWFEPKNGYPLKPGNLTATFVRKKTDRLHLKLYADKTEQVQVRTVKFPGIKLHYQLQAFKSTGAATGLSQTSFFMIESKQARLNDRKCELMTDKLISFDPLTLNSTQTGKVGNEIKAFLGLKCNGIYDGMLDPNGTGSTIHSSGSQVIHTITGVKLTTNQDSTVEGLDKQPKIGLKNDTSGTKAENLYVEGSFKQGVECGSDPIPIAEKTPLNNWPTFGGTNTSVTINPYPNADAPKSIYWKLCKKPGRVPGGSYTGTATLSFSYK